MSQKRLLLVDDSKSARFALRMLLQKYGFQVDMAESAEAALDMLEGEKPDAIFMDHMMPGMDGFEATKSIKNKPDTRHIPVVMCTSNDQEEYVRQAKMHGALGILPKPATPEKLAEILAAMEQEIANAQQPAAPAAPLTPPAPATSVPTSDEIEVLIRNLVPSLLGPSLEPLVDEKLLSRSQESSRAILEQSAVIARETATRVSNAAVSELREEILSASQEQTQSLIASGARKAATEIVDNRIQAQATQLEQEMATRVAGLAGDPSVIKAVRAVAVESTKVKAKEIAAQAARSIATNIAEEAAKRQTSELQRELRAALRSQANTIYLLSFTAAAMGVLAAGLVYYFLR